MELMIDDARRMSHDALMDDLVDGWIAGNVMLQAFPNQCVIPSQINVFITVFMQILIHQF